MAKKKKELKEKLYKPIDSVEDEQASQTLKEDVAPYAIERVQEKVDDDLTEEQSKQLEEAIKAADRGETISEEEFRKRMARWLTK